MNSQYITTDKVGYNQRSYLDALRVAANKQILLKSVLLNNGSGQAMAVAIGVNLNKSSSLVYENTTTPVLASNPNSPTVSGGLVLSSKKKIDFLTWQAMTGTPAIEYWNGSAWASVTLAESSAGGVLWHYPVQGVQGSSYANLPQDAYYVRVSGLSALTNLKVCQTLKFIPSLGDGRIVEIDFSERRTLLEAQETVVPYFGVADIGNFIELSYQVNG